MSLTYAQARDQIFGVFKSAWPANWPVRWPDVPSDGVPTAETVWARATLRHATGAQASLANFMGKRRYSRIGTATFQIFAPVGDGSKAGYDAAQIVTTAFQAARRQVWFRNVRLNEVGTSGAFEQFNVLVDFTYDEVV